MNGVTNTLAIVRLPPIKATGSSSCSLNSMIFHTTRVEESEQMSQLLVKTTEFNSLLYRSPVLLTRCKVVNTIKNGV